MQSKGFFCKYTSAYFWFDVLSLIKDGFFSPVIPSWSEQLTGETVWEHQPTFRATLEKTTGNGVKNHGRRHKKPRATLEKTTGNKIYNDGQRNFKQWATKFRATGNGILSHWQRVFLGNNRYRKFLGQRTSKYLHKPYLYLEIASIFNLFFIHAYLYTILR